MRLQYRYFVFVLRDMLRTMKKQSRAKDIVRRIDARAAELAARAAKSGQKFPTTDRALSLAAVGSTDTLRSIRRNLANNPNAAISLPVIELFARYLEVHEEWLISGTGSKELTEPFDRIGYAESIEALSRAASGTVPLVGYVGAGAATHYYEGIAQENLDAVPAPIDNTPKTVAVEIRGVSLGTMFDRWLVYYDDVRRPVTHDLIGKLCVVGLDDGRVLVKKIRRSRGNDHVFDLLSETEPPIEGATILWAAKVKQLAPQ